MINKKYLKNLRSKEINKKNDFIFDLYNERIIDSLLNQNDFVGIDLLQPLITNHRCTIFDYLDDDHTTVLPNNLTSLEKSLSTTFRSLKDRHKNNIENRIISVEPDLHLLPTQYIVSRIIRSFYIITNGPPDKEALPQIALTQPLVTGPLQRIYTNSLNLDVFCKLLIQRTEAENSTIILCSDSSHLNLLSAIFKDKFDNEIDGLGSLVILRFLAPPHRGPWKKTVFSALPHRGPW